MKFFKDNSYDIVKLFINQIGIAIFSMMLYVSVSLIEDAELVATMKVLVSIFSILFYYALIYTAAWDFGAKDKIKIDGGKSSFSIFKGALLALFANLINFVIVGIAIVCKLIHYGGGAEGFDFAFGILNTVFRFTMSMYLGVIAAIFPFPEVDMTSEAASELLALPYIYQTVAYFVFPIIVIGVTQIGYYLGRRDLRIAYLFSDRNDKNAG